uniref:Uncharacterized protein n=1 Tax=Arundo donax TaxID=35708 RepID=A0A0A9E368_ARUDO
MRHGSSRHLGGHRVRGGCWSSATARTCTSVMSGSSPAVSQFCDDGWTARLFAAETDGDGTAERDIDSEVTLVAVAGPGEDELGLHAGHGREDGEAVGGSRTWGLSS